MMEIKILVKTNDPFSGNATTFSISENGTVIKKIQKIP
jgi:hypothetical protein